MYNIYWYKYISIIYSIILYILIQLQIILYNIIILLFNNK